MSDIPILGDNTTAPDDTDDVKVFYKACKIVMNEAGDCFAIHHDALTATFTEASPNDVINMLRRAVDGLRDQEAAGTMMRTQMAVAAQVQRDQQNRAVLDALNLKQPM
jgi:hypothetical protein